MVIQSHQADTHIPSQHTTYEETGHVSFKHLLYVPSLKPSLARLALRRSFPPRSGSIGEPLTLFQLTLKVERSIESRVLIATESWLFGAARQPS